MSDAIPGPCYPNWPDMVRGAFAVHRQSTDGKTCRYCGGEWSDLALRSLADKAQVSS